MLLRFDPAKTCTFSLICKCTLCRLSNF
jgi:hypothetical protein